MRPRRHDVPGLERIHGPLAFKMSVVKNGKPLTRYEFKNGVIVYLPRKRLSGVGSP